MINRFVLAEEWTKNAIAWFEKAKNHHSVYEARSRKQSFENAENCLHRAISLLNDPALDSLCSTKEVIDNGQEKRTEKTKRTNKKVR